jgi:phosphoserine phosphatase
MQPDAIDVFDLDGTVIKANSFREITKKMLLLLLKKLKFNPALILIGAFILRRMRVLSYIALKTRAVNTFEKELTQEEKHDICQSVFDENVNGSVLERVLASEYSVICTASPYPYVSRMSFGKDVTILSALDPRGFLPDAANLGQGKVKNLIAYFGNDKIRVANFYTDSFDDQPMIDFAENAFMCSGGHIRKIK